MVLQKKDQHLEQLPDLFHARLLGRLRGSLDIEHQLFKQLLDFFPAGALVWLWGLANIARPFVTLGLTARPLVQAPPNESAG